MENKNINNWSIEMGDYIKKEDDYTKSHKSVMKKILIAKIIIKVFVFSAALTVFLFVMKLLTKV